MLVDAALPVVLVLALVASVAVQTAEAPAVAAVVQTAVVALAVVVLAGSSVVALAENPAAVLARSAVVLDRLLPKRPCHCLEYYL